MIRRLLGVAVTAAVLSVPSPAFARTAPDAHLPMQAASAAIQRYEDQQFTAWVNAVLYREWVYGTIHAHWFLICTRSHESSPNPPLHDDGYDAVNPSGHYGAYQFSQSTWNSTARHAGRPDLVGVRPDRASVRQQDLLAWTLYRWQGHDPWLFPGGVDKCASAP